MPRNLFLLDSFARCSNCRTPFKRTRLVRKNDYENIEKGLKKCFHTIISSIVIYHNIFQNNRRTFIVDLENFICIFPK